ncbi:MAG: ribosomal-processing cysteine protease Prp [Erysipelotrichaceae bacterium]|nr:ribosomal-processing cysteine protease Prp [Erysipelotrichaceae bacterium]MBR5754848.1 ribosomal-processing cysteine protease Prp [Erysipelotrichaceae bacterium]
MIRATYELKDDRYVYIKVRGHAEFGEYGRDLICASVSSIMFGFMNALDELDEDIEIKQLKNEIVISSRSDLEKVQDYFRLVVMQLKTIEESYGDFIKVERK